MSSHFRQAPCPLPCRVRQGGFGILIAAALGCSDGGQDTQGDSVGGAQNGSAADPGASGAGGASTSSGGTNTGTTGGNATGGDATGGKRDDSGCVTSTGERSPTLLGQSLDIGMNSVSDDQRLYYETNPSPPVFPDVERAIWSVPLAGGETARLSKIEGKGSLHDLGLRAGRVYFRANNNSGGDRLGHVSTTGGDLEWLPDVGSNITKSALGREHLYYVLEFNPASIGRLHLQDHTSDALVTEAVFPDALVESQDLLYWHGKCENACDQPGREGIWETPIAGGESRLVAEEEGNVKQLLVVDKSIVAHVDASIAAFKRDKGNKTILAEPDEATGFFVSNGIGACGDRVYFAVNTPKSEFSLQANTTIYEVTLEGDQREVMTFSVPGLAPPHFRFDHQGVFFSGSTKIAKFSDEYALYYAPW